MTLSFWLILLAVLAYGLLHSLLASLTVKAFARQWLGVALYHRWYRLAFNILALVSFVPILVLIFSLPDRSIYFIPYPWFILTSFFQIIAVIFLTIGLLQSGVTSFLGIRQLRFPDRTTTPHLMNEGLYRYVRHPLYTAGLVFIWLTPYLSWSVLAINVGLTMYVFIGSFFEERKSLAKFGEAYAEYRRQTPMLVPGLHFHRVKGMTNLRN